MTKINIVFDNAFDDADIIMIPDQIVSDIEKIGQEFLDWIPDSEEPDYHTIINEKKCVVAETDGFIKWLNKFYCKENEKAYVVAKNTDYCSDYKTIEF